MSLGKNSKTCSTILAGAWLSACASGVGDPEGTGGAGTMDDGTFTATGGTTTSASGGTTSSTGGQSTTTEDDDDGGATGGTTSSSGGSDGSGGQNSVTGACAPFATFESGADGFGVFANDGAGTTTVPESFMEGLVETDTSDGADGTSTSVRYAGSGFGSGIRFNVDLLEDCQNIASVTGLSFWVKGSSDAYEAWEVDEDMMIVFLRTPTSLDGSACTSDCPVKPDFRFTLSSEWTEVQIPFEDFNDMDSALASTVESIEFHVRGSSFDVSIDQVGFY